jgi:hypothetical protein
VKLVQTPERKQQKQHLLTHITPTRYNVLFEREGYVNLSNAPWTPVTKLMGFFGTCLELLPLYFSLFLLRSIFQNYQRGNIFIAGNAYYYGRLGGLLFLKALIFQPLAHMLMVLAVTFTNSPGHRYISLSFGTPNLQALFSGMLVMVISWIMLEASKMHDEHRFTV